MNKNIGKYEALTLQKEELEAKIENLDQEIKTLKTVIMNQFNHEETTYERLLELPYELLGYMEFDASLKLIQERMAEIEQEPIDEAFTHLSEFTYSDVGQFIRTDRGWDYLNLSKKGKEAVIRAIQTHEKKSLDTKWHLLLFMWRNKL